MKPFAKFGIVVVVIVGTLGWLAASGISESKAYYKTISEVSAMGNEAQEKRIRVGGDIAQGSIVRKGKEVHFVLTQEKLKLNVVYDGTDPLPDTFRDGAQALADGKMTTDGSFRAKKIQAKCASKYEGKPGFKTAAPAARASI